MTATPLGALDLFDKQFYESGQVKVLAGVDEAGRGPLAGPVCAAAVILNPNDPIEGLNDSKKLTPKKRDSLFPLIKERALSYAIVFENHLVIDQYNILEATKQAMRRAVLALSLQPDKVLIDGNQLPQLAEEYHAQYVIDGDAISASIAAASVLAKVSRDTQMVLLSKEFPHYGFERHKGYGTKLHYERLDQFGISPIHRKTFLKRYSPHKLGASEIGEWGERFAATYFGELGFVIVEQNYSSQFGEIDLIVENEEKLIFVEVKTSTLSDSYAPRENVTRSKQAKIIKTAEVFLLSNPSEKEKEFSVFEILVSYQKDEVRLCSYEYIESAFLVP